MRNMVRCFFAVGSLLLFGSLAMAQATLPHYEGFDYANLAILGDQPGWTALNSGDTIFVYTGSLTYPGYVASTGNKIAFDGAGKDLVMTFDSIATGSIYYSFLMRVTALGGLDATGGYIAGFYQSSTSTATGAPVWTRMNGTSFDVGISARITANTQSWSSGYTVGDTYLIVVAYTFVAGDTNDVAKVWINPDASTFGGTEPAPTATGVNTVADLTSTVRFMLRQDASTKTPFVELDELRLGTSWAAVVPSGGSSYVETMNNAVPQSLQLAQNFPNPFNPSTTIEFAVASTQLVTVKVHDMLGREVATLVDHTLNPGLYRTKWNAMDNPSGLYFYTVRAGNETLTRRMALVK